MLPAIETGEFEEFRLDDLPIGLRDYYRRHWEAMRRSLATPVVRRKPKLEPVRISRLERTGGRANGQQKATTSTRRGG